MINMTAGGKSLNQSDEAIYLGGETGGETDIWWRFVAAVNRSAAQKRNLRAFHVDNHPLLVEEVELRGKVQRVDVNGLFEFISQFSNLEELVMGPNKLITVPSDIMACNKLRILDLAGNHLAELPEHVGTLPCLMELDLSFNQLRNLPEAWFVNRWSRSDCYPLIASLLMLHLQNNAIEDVPARDAVTIFNGPDVSLHYIDLSRNRISNRETVKILLEWMGFIEVESEDDDESEDDEPLLKHRYVELHENPVRATVDLIAELKTPKLDDFVWSKMENPDLMKEYFMKGTFESIEMHRLLALKDIGRKIKQARDGITEVLKIQTAEYFSPTRKGRTLEIKGKFQEALDYYRRSLELEELRLEGSGEKM